MLELLERHQRICDALYQLALEENQHLQTQKRAPTGEFLGRKQALLDELTHNLDSLRGAFAEAGESNRELAALRDRVMQRIQQIIHLDRENEKLVLRYSLPPRGASATAPAAAAPASPSPGLAGGIARAYGKVLPPRR